jgi:AraC-like DNA-binding protein
MKKVQADTRKFPKTSIIEHHYSHEGQGHFLRCEFVYYGKWRKEQHDKQYYHPAPVYTRLFLVNRGSAVILSGDARHILRPGNAYLIPTCAPFTATYKTDLGMIYYHLSITDRSLLSVTDGVPGFVKHALGRKAYRDIANAFNRGDHYLAQVLAFRLVLEMLAPVLAKGGAETHRFARYEPILKLIRRDPSVPFTTDRLAEEMGLTRPALSRAFRRDTGMSLKQYISRYRLGEARKLLVHSELTVADIADRLGFNDWCYFSRFFKRQTGETPGAYRVKYRER